MTTALQGLKIASFEWIVVGPLSTSYLGQQGATVIKMESHTRPDGGRFVAPFKDNIVSPDRSGFFFHQNTSKYSFTLNVKKPEGRDLALRLIKWADVVLENMTPGVMNKLGLGYQDAVAVNPSIIYTSISIQGQFGPHYQSTGYGQMAAALAGCSNLAGWPERIPAPPHGAYVDYITARFVPILILAAVDHRRRTGKGQYIDNSIFENTAYFFSLPVMDYAINGRIANRSGNRHPYIAPHGVFPCRGDDRWIAIVAGTEQQWHALCGVAGKPEWQSDARFATFAGRKANEDKLEALIEQWTVGYNAEELEVVLQRAGVAASVVESNRDLFVDEQLKHRRFFQSLPHQVLGPTPHTGLASKYSRTTEVQRAAPLLGEDNEFVLKEILHLSDDEVGDLYAKGAITTESDFPF